MLKVLAPFPSLSLINAAAQTYPKWLTAYGRFSSHEVDCVTNENAGYVSSLWVQLGLGQA